MEDFTSLKSQNEMAAGNIEKYSQSEKAQLRKNNNNKQNHSGGFPESRIRGGKKIFKLTQGSLGICL